jgi:peptidoglycan/LPS O-acetylase OafA/YrhL
LRAAACLLVVIYHARLAAGGEAAIRAWPNGAAGVDLFFVISGYVMVASSAELRARPDGWRMFLARRLRRIVPLYWLLTAAKLAVTALMPDLTPHTRPTWWNLCASLLFIPARDAAGFIRPVLPVGWSLNFEFFFYALFAAALALRLSPLWLTPVLVAVAAAGFFTTPSWPAPLVLANGMVLEFAAGMALASVPLPRPGRVMGALLATAFALLLMLPQAGPWRFLVWGLPAAAVLGAALVLEAPLGAFIPAAVLAVGDASYAIYLVHPFVVPALAVFGPVAAVLSVPFSVAAGLLVHRQVDARLQRWLRRPTLAEPLAARIRSVLMTGHIS